MQIPNRERSWSFVKSYLMCVAGLFGLYMVVDSLANLDELFELAAGSPSTSKLINSIGRHYLPKISLIYGQVCGLTTTTLAAILAVAWMRKNTVR